ncbi:hypothetical protein HY374_03610 [Candidatus Berkelbacteria bacterium]|nr:hypothetical protein [Candidatus Berkelbacteria bacterium]
MTQAVPLKSDHQLADDAQQIIHRRRWLSIRLGFWTLVLLLLADTIREPNAVRVLFTQYTDSFTDAFLLLLGLLGCVAVIAALWYSLLSLVAFGRGEEIELLRSYELIERRSVPGKIMTGLMVLLHLIVLVGVGLGLYIALRSAW